MKYNDDFHLWRKIHANPKGYATGGGSKGGYLIRGLCSTMMNHQYALSHDLTQIIAQIRLKTKSKTGTTLEYTNAVEDVNSIPYRIYFHPK